MTDIIANMFGKVQRGVAHFELQLWTDFLSLIAPHTIHRPFFVPGVKTKLFTSW